MSEQSINNENKKNQPVHNAADENAVKKKTDETILDRENELNDLREILNLPSGAGVRYFRRFFVQGQIYSTTFTGNSNSFFLEGNRNFALKHFNDICEASPEILSKIIFAQKKTK